MKTLTYITGALILLASCSKEKFEHVEATSVSDFPKQLLLDEEKVGELEDTDKATFEITLTDGIDPNGLQPSGKEQVLEQAVTVYFELTDPEGFSNWSDYIAGGTAYYEIDDCTTSEDEGIDLSFSFDAATGKGSVIFPAGVNSISVELELVAAIMDDAIENSGDRGFTFTLKGISATSEKVVVTTDITTEFRVYDDEKVCGDWVADPSNATEFSNLLQLFTLANPDLDGLTASEVDAVEVAFSFDEFELKFVLLETETVDECGTQEIVPVEITVEGEMDEFDSDSNSGVIHFIAELESENGAVTEISYEGTFSRLGNNLTLTLKGDDGDTETDEFTLSLSK